MCDGKKCGCKGIRTCLLCEQQSDACIDPRENKVIYVYTYCPHCNLCWPDNEETALLRDFPLYLGKVNLHLEFFSEEEETAAITSIDRIPWMPSQSGRRKQDFGPKVNFKKKKVKIGEFKGFPRFTESILKKFQDVPQLSDFQPVELCHLEYSPERGSSIDPHVDDFWLWGERLVTINLGSSTVLTLVPCSSNACDCYEDKNSDYFQPYISHSEKADGEFSCSHKFQGVRIMENSMKTMALNDATFGKNSNIYLENLDYHTKNSNTGMVCPVSSVEVSNENTSEDIQYSADQLSRQTFKLPIGGNTNSLSSSKYSPKLLDTLVDENVKMSYHMSEQNNSDTVGSSKICTQDFYSDISNKDISTMCSIFRKGASDFEAAVRIVLPPRSLLVLAGCARYNWFHEIKRKDVVSRRLAMTFRELTNEFLDGGKESQLGKDLLMTANNFL